MLMLFWIRKMSVQLEVNDKLDEVDESSTVLNSDFCKKGFTVAEPFVTKTKYDFINDKSL